MILLILHQDHAAAESLPRPAESRVDQLNAPANFGKSGCNGLKAL